MLKVYWCFREQQLQRIKEARLSRGRNESKGPGLPLHLHPQQLVISQLWALSSHNPSSWGNKGLDPKVRLGWWYSTLSAIIAN